MFSMNFNPPALLLLAVTLLATTTVASPVSTSMQSANPLIVCVIV
jgi:hypothetical protein